MQKTILTAILLIAALRSPAQPLFSTDNIYADVSPIGFGVNEAAFVVFNGVDVGYRFGRFNLELNPMTVAPPFRFSYGASIGIDLGQRQPEQGSIRLYGGLSCCHMKQQAESQDGEPHSTQRVTRFGPYAGLKIFYNWGIVDLRYSSITHSITAGFGFAIVDYLKYRK